MMTGHDVLVLALVSILLLMNFSGAAFTMHRVYRRRRDAEFARHLEQDPRAALIHSLEEIRARHEKENQAKEAAIARIEGWATIIAAVLRLWGRVRNFTQKS